MTLFGIVLGWPVLFGAGLIVGWWFLPQPGFIRAIGMKLGLVKE